MTASASKPATTFGLGKDRLEALTDGIFATVMTVLILSLSIPAIISSTDAAITSYIYGLGPTVLSYVMSFLILAIFWVRHHNIFHFISRIDNTLIWFNMLFLLTIGFVPFSTDLIGRFWNTEIATIIYGSNLIASGLCMQAIWLLAVRRKLLIVDVLDERVMASVNRRLLGGPGLYLLAIIISLIVPGGTRVAVGIYVAALVYYVAVSSIDRLQPWRYQEQGSAKT
jgi:uncharacterized membrane protein